MKKILFSVFIMVTLLCTMCSGCKKHSASANSTVVNCNPDSARFDTVVLLVMGQSNAANFGETRYAAACSQAVNFYNGIYYPLSDPLYGAKGDGGSVWSRLGDMLIQNSFARVVIIAPVAIGGTSIQQWKPSGVNNHFITETIAALQAKGLKITHVLWHQGESNHASMNPLVTPVQNGQQYTHDFLELVAQLRSLGVNAPIFPAIATHCGVTANDTVLESAQRHLANDSLGIFNGPNTDSLGNEYRFDQCHFNTNGLHVHALLWKEILLAH
ncbi:MAG: uncharacterized protein JWN78_1263 [Bacteroidota bacterium]|nr:uncharacterized protein [Bacteroidota bacterium]